MHITSTLFKPGSSIKFNDRLKGTKYLKETEGLFIVADSYRFRPGSNMIQIDKTGNLTVPVTHNNFVPVKLLISRVGKSGKERLEYTNTSIPLLNIENFEVIKDKVVVTSYPNKGHVFGHLNEKEQVHWLLARYYFLKYILDNFSSVPRGLRTSKYKSKKLSEYSLIMQ